MSYTVKQLADQLSVTKATITNNAKSLNLTLDKIEGVNYITDEQAKQIAHKIQLNKTGNMINKAMNQNKVAFDSKLFEKNSGQSLDNEAHSKVDNQQIVTLNRYISTLEKQLTNKDEQIKQLNNTLDEQQRLLHNQQSLALQSSAKIEQLKTELNEARLKLNSKSDVSDKSDVQKSNTVQHESVKAKNDVPFVIKILRYFLVR